MTKTALRRQYSEMRDRLTAEEIAKYSLSIANASLALPIWQLRSFHIFLTIAGKKEVDTEYLLHVLSGRDKQIIVSKSNLATREMSHFLLSENMQFVVNAWDIPEPVNGEPFNVARIDVVFVPLLAFDVNGHRVGYGKGFYDRFLAHCRKETIKIGLSFFEAAQAIEDVSASDISLDYCITPQRVYSF